MADIQREQVFAVFQDREILLCMAVAVFVMQGGESRGVRPDPVHIPLRMGIVRAGNHHGPAEFDIRKPLRKMLNPFRQPVVWFQYVSHRVLRWSVTPIAMVILLLANTALVALGVGTFFTIVLILQLLFYLAALLGYLLNKRGHKNKLLFTAYYFVFMNLNVFRGMAYLKSHSNSGAWEKAKRS